MSTPATYWQAVATASAFISSRDMFVCCTVQCGRWLCGHFGGLYVARTLPDTTGHYRTLVGHYRTQTSMNTSDTFGHSRTLSGHFSDTYWTLIGHLSDTLDTSQARTMCVLCPGVHRTLTRHCTICNQWPAELPGATRLASVEADVKI